ncbi:helix-turn-helix domain-containing protein [Clostridium algidicarnis]|uniref:helix-turn-helix domain-containing protein n=1 Tax=Clostridium algidicarnis TaxID=37659 RepID=UPI003FD8B722
MQGYTIIDNAILENEGLTKNELIAYIAIVRYYNTSKGYAYPSYRQIKNISKIKDDRTLIKAIEGLSTKDFIIKESIKGIGNKYYIPTVKLQVQESHRNSNNTGTPTGELQEDILENYSTTNTNTNTNTIYSPSDDEQNIDKLINEIKKSYHKDLVKIEFEKLKTKDIEQLEAVKQLDKNLKSIVEDEIRDIWDLYPNKKGKAKVMKKIPMILSLYGYQHIKRAVERYSKEVEGKDKQYIKHGDTFFNGGYEDYLDDNYQEQQSNDREKMEHQAQAQMDHLKGGIDFG